MVRRRIPPGVIEALERVVATLWFAPCSCFSTSRSRRNSCAEATQAEAAGRKVQAGRGAIGLVRRSGA